MTKVTKSLILQDHQRLLLIGWRRIHSEPPPSYFTSLAVVLEKEERLSRGSPANHTNKHLIKTDSLLRSFLALGNDDIRGLCSLLHYKYKKAPQKARLRIYFNEHQFTEAKSRSSNNETY
ncbi:hypothetical protein CWN87_05885 [Vibrio splendidus]|nr:hypothetical protein CWN87_05885 [Vibrio splendidus]